MFADWIDRAATSCTCLHKATRRSYGEGSQHGLDAGTTSGASTGIRSRYFRPSRLAGAFVGSSGTAPATVSSRKGKPCRNSSREITPSPSRTNSSNKLRTACFKSNSSALGTLVAPLCAQSRSPHDLNAAVEDRLSAVNSNVLNPTELMIGHDVQQQALGRGQILGRSIPCLRYITRSSDRSCQWHRRLKTSRSLRFSVMGVLALKIGW
jgi:hypothetical protein